MGEKRQRSILKGVTWRVFATADTLILAFLFTGSVRAALSIGVLEVLTKTLWYYFHERLWVHALVPHRIPAGIARHFAYHGQGRSVLKAVSWRFFGALDTFLISLLVTGHMAVSGSIGGAELVTKLFLYYLHERLWVHVQWGRVEEKPAGVDPIGHLRLADAVSVARYYYRTGLAVTHGVFIVLFLASFAAAAYVLRPTSLNLSITSATIARMEITSTAFENGESIPAAYTCDADNPLNPPLLWSDVPDGAQSLVLIVEDPDVPKAVLPTGIFDHWILFNINPATSRIPAGASVGITGANGAGQNEYAAPCPPPEHTPAEHRYIFRLYALDVELPLAEGADKEEVLAAMQGRILSEAQLMGRYRRVKAQ